MLLLHSAYEGTTIGQKYGIVEVAQARIQIDCRQRLPFSADCICPSHMFSEDESVISENYSVSTLGLLPPTLQSQASWRMDIFVVEKGAMVKTNMHSGLLSVVYFVLGSFSICAGHHPQMAS